MSRGRGRGRGGGPGGGQSQAPMGAVTFKELTELSRDQTKLYPDPDTHPDTQRPTVWEVLVADYQLSYLDRQRHSPYWPNPVQKKTKDLPRYTDRYRPETEDSAGPQLRDAPLQREALPPELAKAFFEGDSRRQKIEKANKEKAKKKIDWEAWEKRDKSATDADDTLAADAEDADEQLGDYEDEEEDDYNDNYFDNGEDDDDGGDMGGDGGADEAEF